MPRSGPGVWGRGQGLIWGTSGGAAGCGCSWLEGRWEFQGGQLWRLVWCLSDEVFGLVQPADEGVDAAGFGLGDQRGREIGRVIDPGPCLSQPSEMVSVRLDHVEDVGAGN